MRNRQMYVHNYAEWDENNTSQIKSKGWASDFIVLDGYADMFGRLNGEGLAYDQMFWISR